MSQLGDPCRCTSPEHKGKPCNRYTAEKKWFACPPCGRHNHTGGPCPIYAAFPDYYNSKRCKQCGYDEMSHGGKDE